MSGRPEGSPGAEAQLSALRGAEARLAGVQEQSRRRLAWFCTALALLIGAAHVIPAVFRPDVMLPAFLTAMGVYVVAVLALTWWYLRTRTATPLGGGRRYLIGLMATFALYAVSMLLMALPSRESWPVAALVGLVIAAPLVIAGWWRRS
ncbi:hypothetical protein AB0K08_05750 [Citricoccus sp. NPDC055426]|uniref:hypothetical protein n=1 Tax=Citricoccus sp. NPDC055426 TaxID=3155536 RepID=UPI003428FDB9